MKKNLIVMLAMAMVCAFGASAQSRGALRINEVMVQNTPEGIADEYGAHVAWIEIFNTNFAPIEISSIYITNDTTPTKTTLYPVPLGDVKTKMPKRQHVLFFADGQPKKGTFHTNFTLTPGQENIIAIYDADGITLIDKVVVPATLLPGQSYARKADGSNDWEIRDGSEELYITPGSANKIKDENHKIKDFAEKDPQGFNLTAMAMGIVFSALLILCLCFYALSKVGSLVSRLNKLRAHGAPAEAKVRDVEQDTGEEIAAIIMALHEHLDAHDQESTVLTINKVRRAYSPWSSKIYNLRQVPDRTSRR